MGRMCCVDTPFIGFGSTVRYALDGHERAWTEAKEFCCVPLPARLEANERLRTVIYHWIEYHLHGCHLAQVNTPVSHIRQLFAFDCECISLDKTKQLTWNCDSPRGRASLP